jgi:hypothetical protein
VRASQFPELIQFGKCNSGLQVESQQTEEMWNLVDCREALILGRAVVLEV